MTRLNVQQLDADFDQFMSLAEEIPSQVQPQATTVPVQKDISDERKKYLRNVYAYQLTSHYYKHRDVAAQRAEKEVTDPAEREWLVAAVRDISKAKEWDRRRKSGGSGFWSAAASVANVQEMVGGSFLEGFQRTGKAFIGPGRLFGGTPLTGGKKRSLEDRQFLDKLEAAKTSENPYVPKDASLVTKGLTGAAGFAPDAIGGGLATLAAGPAGLATYGAARTGAETVEGLQDIGLDPLTAGLAAIPTSIATGAAEILNIDPTGFTKRAAGPIGRFLGGKILSVLAKKAVPAAAQRGLRTGGRIAKTIALEDAEEFAQAAIEETTKYIAGEVSKKVERRDPTKIVKKGFQAAKEALPAVAVAGGVGPSLRAVGFGGKQVNVQHEIQDAVLSGKKISRADLKRWGISEKIPEQERAGELKELARSFDVDQQLETLLSGRNPTAEDWKRWDFPIHASKTAESRRAYLEKKLHIDRTEGQKNEEIELSEAVQQPVVAQQPQEVPVAPSETVQPPQAPEVAPEQQAAPEAPATIVEPFTPDKALDLSKADGERIRREVLKLEELPEEAPQEVLTVLSEVWNDGSWKNAMGLARDVIQNRRPTSTKEHAMMSIMARQLDDNIASARAAKKAAKESGDEFAWKEADTLEDVALREFDQLVQAARFSGREVGRAMNIRKQRDNVDKFDVESLITKAQKAKGFGGTVTKGELKTLSEQAAKIKELQKQVEEMEMQDQIFRETAASRRADTVLKEQKAKAKKDKRRKEKAATDIERAKENLRQLLSPRNIKVYDISAIGAEGMFRVGQLGIAYVKSGANTLQEVIDSLRKSLPQLNLSQYDVYQALNAFDPKRKARAKTDAQKRVDGLKAQARTAVKLEDIRNDLPQVRGRVQVASRKLRELRRALAQAKEAAFVSSLTATRIERALAKIRQLESDVANGIDRIKKEKVEVDPVLEELNQKISELTRELDVGTELRSLAEQFRTGEFVQAPVRVQKPVSKRLEKKQIDLHKQRTEAKRIITDMEARKKGDLLVKGGRAAKAIADNLKAIAATADLSFTMRQNIWQVFSHPILASKAFAKSLGVLKPMSGEDAAEAVANGIRNSKYFDLYDQAGLTILDHNDRSAQNQGEVFRGRYLENAKIFGKRNPIGVVMAMSSRHSVAIGNLMRTSAFDAFMDSNQNATQEEMRALADYINVSTGLGNLDVHGSLSTALDLAMFSPRFAISRFQTLLAPIKHRHQPRVRREIAKDFVKVFSAGSTLLMLAKFAGLDVELLDVDDPDWMKIRVGNTRFDPWGGFIQVARLLGRLTSAPFRGEKDKVDPISLAKQFVSYKASPAISILSEMVYGKDMVGNKSDFIGALSNAFTPLVVRDIEDAWKEDGPEAAAAVAILAILGVGVSTYEDSKTAKRRKEKFDRKIEKNF